MLKKLAIGWASWHLLLVLLGALQFRPAELGPFGSVVDIYGRLTGTRGGFAFFSVNIPNQVIFRYVLIDSDGAERVLRLEDYFHPEMTIRYHAVLRNFSESYSKGNEAIYKAIAATFSTYVLNRFPEAKTLRLEVIGVMVTNLANYSPNQEFIEKDLVYEATYRRLDEDDN